MGPASGIAEKIGKTMPGIITLLVIDKVLAAVVLLVLHFRHILPRNVLASWAKVRETTR
jgi:hypothetical protein